MEKRPLEFLEGGLVEAGGLAGAVTLGTSSLDGGWGAGSETATSALVVAARDRILADRRAESVTVGEEANSGDADGRAQSITRRYGSYNAYTL